MSAMRWFVKGKDGVGREVTFEGFCKAWGGLEARHPLGYGSVVAGEDLDMGDAVGFSEDGMVRKTALNPVGVAPKAIKRGEEFDMASLTGRQRRRKPAG